MTMQEVSQETGAETPSCLIPLTLLTLPVRQPQTCATRHGSLIA